jgi:hypothetical protein
MLAVRQLAYKPCQPPDIVFPRLTFASVVVALAAVSWSPLLLAHAVPDIPVQAFFEADGSSLIRVEVDPRCFAADPEKEPFLQNWVLGKLSAADKDAMIGKAVDLLRRSIELRFEPLGKVQPEFTFRFTGQSNKALQAIEDPVMITGEWRTKLPAGLEGYRIKALPGEKLSVVMVNHLRGVPVERIHVLFPGETSYLLDLTGLTAALPTAPLLDAVGATGGSAGTFWNLLRQGFVHVVPLGLDHILFVLGVFLLSRRWRPLLWQVTAFTLAHTLTLGLATLGIVRLPSSIVEPVIAASIAVIAVENILLPRYNHWRLAVVFVFGLIHGLGFAGALADLELNRASLVTGLLGFNLGVEAGQLVVIGAAFLATIWIKEESIYRKVVVIPGSALIAVMGIWWMFERLLTRG